MRPSTISPYDDGWLNHLDYTDVVICTDPRCRRVIERNEPREVVKGYVYCVTLPCVTMRAQS